MNGLPYYKRYPRDLVEGTIGMPFEEKVTYAFVLDMIYMQGGYLPDDARYIAGLLGCSVRKWAALRDALIKRGKLVVDGTCLTNYRALSELESLRKLSERQSEKRRGRNRNNDLPKPQIDHTEPEPEPEERPKGLSPARTRRAETDATEAEFDEWWEEYPHKVGKGHARKAYKTARKKVTAEALLRAVEAQREAMLAKDPQYRPHPTTWLNGERWQDKTGPPAEPQLNWAQRMAKEMGDASRTPDRPNPGERNLLDLQPAKAIGDG